MPEKPKVFVSATSGDLESYRNAVCNVLLTLDAAPVIQEHFAPDHRSVLAMLREKIGECNAVICLVGHRYGSEPLAREADQPRRSYTQLEYEIAVELKKRVFIFVATRTCTFDAPPDESEELLALQQEHLNRIIACDHFRMQFDSLRHLTEQVRVMRFDTQKPDMGVTSRLAVLLLAELIDAEAVREKRGALVWVRDIVQPFQNLVQESLTRWSGKLRAQSPSEYEVNFETADGAVNAALALHDALRRHGWKGLSPALRVGIHVGQIVQFEGVEESSVLQASPAIDECRQLTRLAVAGQTLLTRTAFDIAREHVRQAPYSGENGAGELAWQSHGRYLIDDSAEPLEVHEVGVSGLAPFTAPPDSDRARRADPIEQRQIPPWRPAVGQEVPRRPGWFLERKLGGGGFAEVWVARQAQNPLLRVFKFCLDANRLGSFKRERALFQLLYKTLGDRPDIARLLDVNLEQGPFFLESEFVEGGNLREWCESGCRLAALPLEERLRLVAEIGKALAAAHSVGVIHKDLKPTNVLMRQGPDGLWHPSLTDFGIGGIVDRSKLEQQGILLEESPRSPIDLDSSQAGTGMYQPPEVNLGHTATVQADVYALGVILFQMLIGNFKQPMGQGFERRLEAARARGLTGEWNPEGEASPEPGVPCGDEAPSQPRREDLALPNGETPSSTASRDSSPATDPPGAGPLPALDPSGELRFSLLKDDIGICVDGDPSVRLATAAQLVERLQTLDQRIADGLARRRAESARIRMQRLRASLVTSITALIVVGGLGVFAVMEWRLTKTLKDEADQARKTADQSAQQATENKKLAEAGERKAQADAEAARRQSGIVLFTLNEVISDIQNMLADLSESRSIRGRSRDTMLGRLEKLSGEIVKLSTTDRSTATTLRSTGDLLLQFGEPPRSGDDRDLPSPTGELRGASESARRFYMRSMEMFRDLDRADPNNGQAKRDLAIAYQKLGEVHLRLGDSVKALQSYQKDLNLYEALAKADPNNGQAKRDLAASYNRLAEVHLQLRATDTALRFYQEGLKLSESLVNADPSDAQAKRDLSVWYNRLGRVYLQGGDTGKALQYFDKVLGQREALVQADPNDAQAERDLRGFYIWLGDMHLQRGDTDKALQNFDKNLKRNAARVQADRNDGQAKRDLSTSYNQLGGVYLQRGDTLEALRLYQKGLDLRKALALPNPNDAQVRGDLSNSHNLLGDAHLRRGDIDKALLEFREDLKLSEAPAKADRANIQAQQDFSRSLFNIARTYEQAKDLDRARPSYEKMLGVDRGLSQRFPRDAPPRLKLAEDCLILSRICAGSRDWQTAVSYAREAIDRAREAHQLVVKGQNVRWDFAIALVNLGKAQKGAGQLKEARQTFEEAVQEEPESSAAHTALAWFLATCWDDSIRDGKRAVEVATKLGELTDGKKPNALDTLAAAYAEAGRFDDAVKWQSKVLEHLKAFDASEVPHLKERLTLYVARKPYHEPRPELAPGPRDRAPSR